MRPALLLPDCQIAGAGLSVWPVCFARMRFEFRLLQLWLYPALDREVLVCRYNFGEFELIFKLRKERIAFDLAMYAGEIEFAAAGQHLLVYFTATGYPDGFIGVEMIEHLQVCKAVDASDFAWCATEDECFAPW